MDMVFVTAQPDEPFFIWQLTLLIDNLNELSVSKQNIHIVVSFDPFFGLNKNFKKFISQYQMKAKFFIYPDSREQKTYQPSIRPHLLKQHFDKYKSLKRKPILYIDSDVLFSRIPKVNTLDQFCYVSDTRHYLDSRYIIKNGSESLLIDMAKVVNISIKTIISGDENAGGAQYLLKGIDSFFWEKVEENSNKIHEIISKHHTLSMDQSSNTSGSRDLEKTLGAMSWCADMWGVLWTLWHFGHQVRIHQELDFLWPSSSIDQWGKKAILHYTGPPSKKIKTFRKGNYKWFPPWFDPSLIKVSNKSCSWVVCQRVFRVKNSLLQNRPLLQTCIVIYGSRINSNTNLIRDMLQREYNCKVISAKLENKKIKLSGKDLEYLTNNNSNLSHIIMQPAGYLVDPITYPKYLLLAKEENLDRVKIRSHKSYVVDTLHLSNLKLSLDFNIVSSNKNKFYTEHRPQEILLIKNPFKPNKGRKQDYLSLDSPSYPISSKTIIKRNTYLIPNE